MNGVFLGDKITIGTAGPYTITSGSTIALLPERVKSVRYLYKAYVIDNSDNIVEIAALIAKDEVTAKVKAILASDIAPDDVNVVIVQRLGEVPAVDDAE